MSWLPDPLGASHARIIFKHIIPNTLSLIITYAPFAISGGIVALTSLDYLGFGLPAPTPQLLQQGWTNMDAWWISSSVVGALVLTLMVVTFTGEAIREAFESKCTPFVPDFYQFKKWHCRV